MWLSKHVSLVSIKRKNPSALHHRSQSRMYQLSMPDLTKINVCRLTILNTLGYSNDSVITELVAAIKSAPCDANVKEHRGENRRGTTRENRDMIVDHIKSFRPCVSL